MLNSYIIYFICISNKPLHFNVVTLEYLVLFFLLNDIYHFYYIPILYSCYANNIFIINNYEVL